MTATANATEVDRFTREWQEWHDELDEARRRPDGFLAYTSINLIDTAPQRFDDVPGTWTTGPGGPTVELEPGSSITIGERTTTGRHDWGVIGERTFHKATIDSVLIEVSRRGGRDLVRPLRPEHALREGFRGTPAYAPDPAWVITGTLEPSEAEIQVDSVFAPVTHTHDSPGRVRFVHAGVEHTLLLIRRSPTLASALFRDATSGVTTYAASRSLAVTLPTDGSTDVVLDFNRASNLQCAYTDYSPCPLAPRENHLPFAVEAGEKTPLDRTS